MRQNTVAISAALKILHKSDEYDPIFLRDQNGWTLERLAEELDFSVSAVTKWCCRKRNPGRLARKAAYRVASNLGLVA
jgi:DNA-binding transcriptional regulator YiaG